MALGILSSEDFEKELDKSVELVPSSPVCTEIIGEVRDKVGPSRGLDNKDIPNSLRRVIGEESVINGHEAGRELARQFGISDQHVRALGNGSTSLATYKKQPNLDFLNSRRLRVSTKATKVLAKALTALEDDEKLAGCSAPELAGVARSMAGIVKDMEPQQPKSSDGDGVNRPTFVFYAPQVKTENFYETVNAPKG